MASIRHLARAPITEAIVDVKARSSRAIDDALLEQLTERVSVQYPTSRTIQTRQLTFQFSPSQEPYPQVEPQPVVEGRPGFLFKSIDDLEVVEFRRDGFTFHRLEPYVSWEDVFTKAQILWCVYEELFGPEVIERCALRYINRLVLSPAPSHLSDILVGPMEPPLVGTGTGVLAGYFARASIKNIAPAIDAVVTQAIEQSAEESELQIILDIDVFSLERTIPIQGQLPPVFDALHQAKNELFFGSITESVVERFQ